MTVREEMRTSRLLTVGESPNHGQGPGFHVQSICDQKVSDKY